MHAILSQIILDVSNTIPALEIVTNIYNTKKECNHILKNKF